jgi:non-heme chloroperoxidase
MMNSVAGIMLRTPVRVAYECARTFMGADLRPCLAKISAPTLVIHGDKDVSAPLAITGQRLAVGIPGAQLKVYEGGPHGLFTTHAEELTADIEAFAA